MFPHRWLKLLNELALAYLLGFSPARAYSPWHTHRPSHSHSWARISFIQNCMKSRIHIKPFPCHHRFAYDVSEFPLLPLTVLHTPLFFCLAFWCVSNILPRKFFWQSSVDHLTLCPECFSAMIHVIYHCIMFCFTVYYFLLYFYCVWVIQKRVLSEKEFD